VTGPLEPGRDLREQFKPLACQRGFKVGEAGGVSTRAVEPRDDAARDGITHIRKDDRDRLRLPLDGNGRRGRCCDDDVRLQADQLLRGRSYPVDVIVPQSKVHPYVAAIGPTQARKRLRKYREAEPVHDHADATHALALLRPHRHRPRRRAP
jgi:hypothetical protein